MFLNFCFRAAVDTLLLHYVTAVMFSNPATLSSSSFSAGGSVSLDL